MKVHGNKFLEDSLNLDIQLKKLKYDKHGNISRNLKTLDNSDNLIIILANIVLILTKITAYLKSSSGERLPGLKLPDFRCTVTKFLNKNCQTAFILSLFGTLLSDFD